MALGLGVLSVVSGILVSAGRTNTTHSGTSSRAPDDLLVGMIANAPSWLSLHNDTIY